MTATERKETIEVTLTLLKNAIIQTNSSMAIYDNKLIFFGTDDYIKTKDINKCPRFSVDIQDLVR